MTRLSGASCYMSSVVKCAEMCRTAYGNQRISWAACVPSVLQKSHIKGKACCTYIASLIRRLDLELLTNNYTCSKNPQNGGRRFPLLRD